MTLWVAECGAHGREPNEECRQCAMANLVNRSAERDALEARVATLTTRLRRVLQHAGQRRRPWPRPGVWSGLPLARSVSAGKRARK